MTRFSVTALFGLAALCVSSSPGQAGPNSNGALILATPDVVFCQADCGMIDLSNCEDAVTNLPGYTPDADLWFVMAAFASDASPRVTGVTFGVDFDASTVFLADFAACGDFELADGNWPEPGSGTAVTWNEPQFDLLNTVYWFVGYEYYGNDTAFDLIAHPGQGASFADDSVPAELDPIELLGSLGFNDDPGSLPCPQPLGATGACCFSDGSCQTLDETECSGGGGEYRGDDTSCDPNPCGISPTFESSWGEVKALYR